MEIPRPHRIMTDHYLVDCRERPNLTIDLSLWSRSPTGRFDHIGVKRIPSSSKPLHFLMARETEEGLSFGFRKAGQSINAWDWKAGVTFKLNEFIPLKGNTA